jgi:hypothetical protein
LHIGIDDIGAFAAGGGRAFVAAAFVRPGRSEATRELLRSWEKRIGPEFRTAGGEVKGHLVPDEALFQFIDDVILKSDPPLRYECAGVELDRQTFTAVAGQRRLTVEQLRAGIQQYRAQGAEFQRIANRYVNLLGWWEKLPDEQLLQMLVLSHVIPPALNFSIGWSAANGFDDELADLRFKIDEGFLSTSNERKIFWKDMLRSHLWQATKTGGGIIFVKEWSDDHPFLATFVARDLGDSSVELTPEFKARIDFYKSHEAFEIRLADIVGNIVRRLSPLPDRFADQHIDRRGWRLLRFSGKSVDVPSPYEA